jgi:hypothetical protein
MEHAMQVMQAERQAEEQCERATRDGAPEPKRA